MTKQTKIKHPTSFTPPIYELLKEDAETEGKSITEIVRGIVEAHYRDRLAAKKKD